MKLSGTALLMGRLRAESLNLVDAELAVRITPDGYVTVSAGDNAQAARHRRCLKKTGRSMPRQSAATPVSPVRPSSSGGQTGTAADGRR